MFAVHGKDGRVVGSSRVGHQLACRNQRFLVRQCDDLAGFDRGHDGFKPGAADDGGDHHVGVSRRGLKEGGFAGRHTAGCADKPLLKFATLRLVRNYRKRCIRSPGDLSQRFHVGCGGHRRHFELIGRALDQVERRRTD